MIARFRSRPHRGRMSALRTLAALEPSPCILASRDMPLHKCSSRAQDDLSAEKVSIGNDLADNCVELDSVPQRYKRGRAMALHARVNPERACAPAERGLATPRGGCMRVE